MKRRVNVIAAVASLCLAACVFAAEPWKSKDYEKWTSRDVERILSSSPWAHLIGAPRTPYTNGDIPDAGASARVSSGKPASGTDPLHAGDSSEENGFILRWNSSITIRRALYRQAVLKGTDPEAAKESYLGEADTDDYELVLISAAETILPWDDTRTLKQEAYLEFDPSKARVSPAAAKVQEMVDAHGHRGFAFWFPKRLEGGAPAIPEGTTNVVFHMHIGPTNLFTAFKPAEMIGADGPDVQ